MLVAKKSLPGRLFGLLVFLQGALIVTGGAVRLTGSGLGCPTWPECTPGSYTPVPYQAEGALHAWIEFGNRLLTFVLLFTAVAALIVAIKLSKNAVMKTRALAKILTKEGYAATTDKMGSGEEICQHHCPIAHVASEFPQLCEAETAAFSAILGTHVQRLATIAHGDGVCTTFIPSNNSQKRKSKTKEGARS